MTPAQLYEYIEDNFDCAVGPPYAFFTIPTRPGVDDAIIAYVSYVVEGPSLEAVTEYMHEKVFQPLVEMAGETDGAALYWRLEDHWHLTEVSGRHRFRTRIAVIDYNGVTHVAPSVTPEGERLTQI